jgi:hypothetical protein
LGPKDLIGGDLLDLGPGRPVEHPEQAAGVLAGLESRPSQGRHAGDRLRPGHDEQEPAGDTQADSLGLGDGGEFVLLLAGDLDGLLQPQAEGPILGLPVGQASPQFLDPGLGGAAADGLDDLLCLAIERLPGLNTLLGHLGHIAVSTTEHGEGGGDALRDRGHGETLRRDRSSHHDHDCTRHDGNCPRITPAETPF